MIGRIIFCPGPFMRRAHLQHIHLWFQCKTDSNGAYPECPVSPYPDNCPNSIIWNTPEKILLKDHAQRKSYKHLVAQISRKDMITWHEMKQSQQPHHCIADNDAPIQLANLAKSGTWHCHLQWQCTRSRCMRYMMQEGYQWKEDELLFTCIYMPHANIHFFF